MAFKTCFLRRMLPMLPAIVRDSRALFLCFAYHFSDLNDLPSMLVSLFKQWVTTVARA